MKTTKEIYEIEAADLVAIRIEQLKKKQEEDHELIVKNIRINLELPDDVDISISNGTSYNPEVKIFDYVFEVIYHDNFHVSLMNDLEVIRNKLEYGQFIVKKNRSTLKFDMPIGELLNEAKMVRKLVHIHLPQAREINENDSKPIYNHPTIIEKIFRQVKKLIKK